MLYFAATCTDLARQAQHPSSPGTLFVAKLVPCLTRHAAPHHTSPSMGPRSKALGMSLAVAESRSDLDVARQVLASEAAALRALAAALDESLPRAIEILAAASG